MIYTNSINLEMSKFCTIQSLFSLRVSAQVVALGQFLYLLTIHIPLYRHIWYFLKFNLVCHPLPWCHLKLLLYDQYYLISSKSFEWILHPLSSMETWISPVNSAPLVLSHRSFRSVLKYFYPFHTSGPKSTVLHGFYCHF